MKFGLTFVFLFIFAFALSPAFAQKSVSIQGQLLKASGKALPYVELELVPTDASEIVIDQRLIAASSTSGKFSFIDVPDGKYTLSVNFGDKPTNLSPYPEYFYPNALKRADAQIFEVARGSKFPVLIFRLPPPLVERKIAGKVTMPDGTPVGGAYIAVRDVLFDRSIMFGAVVTDGEGRFSVKGYEGRAYQFGALVFERDIPNRSELVNPVIAAGESQIFRLDAQTPLIKFEIRTQGNFNRLKDKYIGMTTLKNREVL